jgi:hypothetical protein
MIGATDDRLAGEEKCQSAVGLSTRSLPEGGLIGAFPRPVFLDSHPQLPPPAPPPDRPPAAPAPGPTRLAGWAVLVKKPPDRNYISMGV